MDYSDLLNEDEIENLKCEFLNGPKLAYEGVHPNATKKERKRIGQKQFYNKFLAPRFSCPWGHYPKNISFDRRSIAEKFGWL